MKEEFKPMVIRPAQLRQVAGISQSTAWRLEQQGQFPRRRRLTPGGSVGYLYSEVEKWLQERKEIV